jgi:CheY-like chemotaxis protein
LLRKALREQDLQRFGGSSLATNLSPESCLAESVKKKILVVDDDDAIRTMVERVLRREQFDVESARDGFEAIEKLARNDYATVLLDLMMPRVDGHGVLRFLENERSAPAPWVIVMTANMQGAHATADAKPVFRVVPKPFDIRQLVSHVKECYSKAPEETSLDQEAAAS